jgi:hypothetical protein
MNVPLPSPLKPIQLFQVSYFLYSLISSPNTENRPPHLIVNNIYFYLMDIIAGLGQIGYKQIPTTETCGPQSTPTDIANLTLRLKEYSPESSSVQSREALEHLVST